MSTANKSTGAPAPMFRTLYALGTPAPQGSKSAVTRGGRAFLIEGSSTAGRQKHRAWRQAVAAEAHNCQTNHGPLPEDAPLKAVLHFVFAKPKSAPKYRRWTTVKPDLDKLCRSTLDGLADGGLFNHDQRVCFLVATKRYATPGEPLGCRVDVSVLNHEDA